MKAVGDIDEKENLRIMKNLFDIRNEMKLTKSLRIMQFQYSVNG